jgi:hypothetical protein
MRYLPYTIQYMALTVVTSTRNRTYLTFFNRSNPRNPNLFLNLTQIVDIIRFLEFTGIWVQPGRMQGFSVFGTHLLTGYKISGIFFPGTRIPCPDHCCPVQPCTHGSSSGTIIHQISPETGRQVLRISVVQNRGDQEAPVHTPRGRFELPRREAPVAFEATAFPG